MLLPGYQPDIQRLGAEPGIPDSKERRTRVLTSSRRDEWMHFSWFCSIEATHQLSGTHHAEGKSFHLVLSDSHNNLPEKTLIDTPRNSTSPVLQVPLHPVKITPKPPIMHTVQFYCYSENNKK